MLGDAEQTLRTGVAYCAERDLDSSWLMMQAWLSGVCLEQGNTGEALRLAADVLRHPEPSLVSRIAALLTTGLAAVRRGDPAVEERTRRVARAGPRYRGAAAVAAGDAVAGGGGVDRGADRRHRRAHRRGVVGLRQHLGAVDRRRIGLVASTGRGGRRRPVHAARPVRS